jgi:hypothetical protein
MLKIALIVGLLATTVAGAEDVKSDELKIKLETVIRQHWTTFINAYPVATGKHLWLGLSYGSRANKKLLEDIKTCFGPVSPPASGVVNPKIEKERPGAAR